MADLQTCIDGIIAAAKGKLTRQDVLGALDMVLARKERIKLGDPLKSDSEALFQAAREVGDEEKIAALIEKRSRAINVLRKQENTQFVTSVFTGKENRGIQALTVGIEGREVGSALSQDAQAIGLRKSALLGPMVSELRKAGLLNALTESAFVRAGQAIGYFKDRAASFVQFERDVARELWRIDDPQGIMRPSPASGNNLAVTAAKIIHKYQETGRLLQNDAGAWIRKMPGYIVTQSHDMLKVAGKGTEADYQKWRANILPKLDQRTFEGVQDKEAFMRNAWQSLSTGLHERPNSDWLGGFKGPGNAAKRVSQERVLHFNSADDWFSYNEAYGVGSFFEAAMHGLNNAAKTTAALRTWGTNPEAAFSRLREELADQAKSRGDIKTARLISGQGKTGDYLQRQFDAANGYLGAPESPSLARVGSNVRAGVSMSSLGGVLLSSFPDMGVAASVLKHNGVGLLARWHAATFGGLLRGGLTGEAREAADILGAGIDAMIGGVVNRFAATDSFHGTMSKMQDIYFRVNGLALWTDRLKEGVATMLASHMAKEAPKEFGALDPRHQVTLGRYGITGDTWNLLRKAVATGEDGRKYMMPDTVAHISNNDMARYLGKPEASDVELNRARENLATKLRAYYGEQTQEALTEPGAKEKAITTMGTRPGTPIGELVRTFMQFKSFSTTFVTRQLGREIYRAEDRMGAIGNVATLIAATTVLGALSLTASDISKGRTPRNPIPMDPKQLAQFWNAALLKGGGAGIYGDFIFGTSNRFGQSVLETAAGPTLGRIADLKRIFDTAVSGDAHAGRSALAQGARFLSSNVPGLNLFYTRMALDYLINYRVQEMINPGFLGRYEASVKRNSGQTFLISPQKFVNQGIVAPSH